jgi:hypothetical protein
MSKTRSAFLVVWILILGACSDTQAPVTDRSSPETATATTNTPSFEHPTPPSDLPGISPEQLRNSEYQLGLLDQIHVVQLVDGRYQEGEPGGENYVAVSMSSFIAHGDLTGDGEYEVAVIVTETYGDTGTFVFLSVYRYLDDRLVFLTSIFIDDQPLFNELSIVNGEILVDVAVHASDDPTCCPSVETKRSYWLNGVNLVLTSYSTKTPVGDPRVITIEAPLDGVQVSGIIRIKGSVTVSPFENNLVYRIYTLGGVELSAGPISVDSIGLGAPGTFEKAIDLGGILTNTTIRIEVEDINIADGSLFAMDSVLLHVR